MIRTVRLMSKSKTSEAQKRAHRAWYRRNIERERKKQLERYHRSKPRE